MVKIIFNILSKKFVVGMIVLLTLQQIFVALSTTVLGLAGRYLSNFNVFVSLLIAFFVFSTIPHLFSIYLKKLEMKGYFEAYFEYLRKRLLNHSGSPQKWQNHQQKESFLTALGPDAEGYISAVAFSIFDIYMFALTIVLNVISISIVVDTNFSYVFFFSGILSGSLFFLCIRKVESIVESEQSEKIDFFSYILKAWDNVFLKNTSVNKLYKEALEKKYNLTSTNIEKSAFYSEGLVFVLTIVSSVPVFGLILYLAFTHQGDTALMGALLVTIPKQLMILGNFRAFFNQITNLSSFKARFKSSWDNSDIKDSHLEERIDLTKIVFGGHAYSSLEKIEQHLIQKKNGRSVIRGANGSGKSTLLLHLNMKLESSFYLPASPQLEIGEVTGCESTGEKILKHLEFIKNQDVKVLLLDEWDANLDQANIDKIHKQLEEISQDKLVIEVRHRLS